MRHFRVVLLFFLFACESDQTRRDRFFQLGNKSLEAHRHDEAIRQYSEALRIDPNYALAYNNRGVAKFEEDRPYEAIQDYNQAIQIDPEYWESIHNRAQANAFTGRYDQSLEDYQVLQEAFPDSTLGYFGKGMVLTRMRRYPDAAAAFREVLAIRPNDKEALINLGTVEYYRGALDPAEELMQAAISLDSIAPNAYNTLNQIYLKRNDPVRALEAINKALQMVPSEPYFLNNRGLTYLELGSLTLAIEDINQSIVLDPKNMWAFRNKGIYFLQQSEPEQALDYLTRAAASRDFIEDVYFYLGNAHWLLKDTEAACASWSSGMDEGDQNARMQYEQLCD